MRLLFLLLAVVAYGQQFADVDNVGDELQKLCAKKYSDYYCGVGSWNSKSKDEAVQIATWHAKAEIAKQIEIANPDEDNISERITGIRASLRTTNILNATKQSEICVIPDIKGKVSLTKINEDDGADYYLIEYHILVNGKTAGTCSYQKSEFDESEYYVVKVGNGVPNIKIQESRAEYVKDEKKYKAYIMVILPKTAY